MSNKVPLFRTVFAEVCTYDPVITKHNPLFYLQIALAVWHLVLISVIVANIIGDFEFNWNVFGGIWIGIDTVIMLLIWVSYRLWLDACSTLPFPGLKRRDERTLVIGKPMHTSISRSILASTLLFSVVWLIFGFIFTVNVEFNGLIEHTIELTLLHGLLVFSVLIFMSAVTSIASQQWPLANVQEVMVCIPTSH